MVVKLVLAEMEDGIYKVTAESLNRVGSIVFSDGVKTLIFFLNRRCVHCLALAPEIEGLLGLISKSRKNVTVYIVLCGWFTEECDSDEAKKIFETFSVDSTPTIIMVEKRGDGLDKTFVDPSNLIQAYKLL